MKHVRLEPPPRDMRQWAIYRYPDADLLFWLSHAALQPLARVDMKQHEKAQRH